MLASLVTVHAEALHRLLLVVRRCAGRVVCWPPWTQASSQAAEEADLGCGGVRTPDERRLLHEPPSPSPAPSPPSRLHPSPSPGPGFYVKSRSAVKSKDKRNERSTHHEIITAEHGVLHEASVVRVRDAAREPQSLVARTMDTATAELVTALQQVLLRRLLALARHRGAREHGAEELRLNTHPVGGA